MARKGFNRNQPRDANGRFASGGGGSRDPRGPAKVGRSGKRGGKVGTRAEQARAKKAQTARTAQFHSKAGATSAKAAYKAAARGARLSERRAAARPPARRRPAAPARRMAPISQKSVERGIATTLRASRMIASATGSALAKVPKAQREAKRQRMQARVAARRAELARNMETVDRNEQAAAYRKMRAANKAAARDVFRRVGRTERTYPRRPRR